jgi:two-component system phosphate regulon sensor histidine kinase PhoR
MGTDFSTQTEPELQPTQTTKAKSMRLRLFAILFASFLVMIAIIAACLALTMRSWQNALQSEIQRDLTQKARMFASAVDHDHTRNIAILTAQEGQDAGARATVIDMNGKVIADSQVRVSELNDEGRRPEFVAALHGDTGVDIRSHTQFGIPVLYVAVPLSGGAVRLAYPLGDIAVASAHATWALVAGCAVAMVLASVISGTVSWTFMRR